MERESVVLFLEITDISSKADILGSFFNSRKSKSTRSLQIMMTRTRRKMFLRTGRNTERPKMSQDEIRVIVCGTELLDLSLFDENTASKCTQFERTIDDDVVIEEHMEPTIVRGAYRAYFTAEKAARLSATGLPGAKIAPGEWKDASRERIHGYVKDQQTLDTANLHTFLNQNSYFVPIVLSLILLRH